MLIDQDPWAIVAALTESAQRSTFAVGDVWLSPGQHRFEVMDVSVDGVATLRKQGGGWARVVTMRWNSPMLHRWSYLGHKSRPQNA